MNPTKPKHDDDTDFVTKFDSVPGAGFFPGAGGYFHGCEGSARRTRIVFYGTDWGTWKEWRKVERLGSETPGQTTIKALRELVEEVANATDAVDLPELRSWCYLSNAVLALAKAPSNRRTYQIYKKPQHRAYLRKCGEEHQRWLRNQEPGLVVLLGGKHLQVYGCRIWSCVWPDLFGSSGEWCGLELPDVVHEPRPTEAGQRVLVLYHPSSGTHWTNHRERAKQVLVAEVDKLRPVAATETTSLEPES